MAFFLRVIREKGNKKRTLRILVENSIIFLDGIYWINHSMEQKEILTPENEQSIQADNTYSDNPEFDNEWKNAASPWKRLLAAFFDVAIIIAIGVIGFFPFFIIISKTIPLNDMLTVQNYVIFYCLFYFIGCVWIYWLYMLLMTWLTKGGTIGKMAASIQVVRYYGLNMKFTTCFSREVLKMILHIIFPVHLLMFFSKQRKALHDTATQTMVIPKKWKYGKLMLFIIIIAMVISIAGIYFAQHWAFMETTRMVNIAKDAMFNVPKTEGQEDSPATEKGNIEELFFSSLYNGTRSVEEINVLKNILNSQLYDESDIRFLFAKDSDKDGLNDNLEIKYKTNSHAKDTDSDGRSDLEEIQDGTTPSSKENFMFSSIDTVPFQAFNEVDFSFTLQYPVGWSFKRSDRGDYIFAKINEKSKELGDPMVGIYVKEIGDSTVAPFYYDPKIYSSAVDIKSAKVGGQPAQIIYYEDGMRLVEISLNDSIIQIFEIIPEDIGKGVFEGILNSFQIKK